VPFLLRWGIFVLEVELGACTPVAVYGTLFFAAVREASTVSNGTKESDSGKKKHLQDDSPV
jgi:hypothetical protein